MLHTTLFYSSKISIPNGSASLFEDADFYLRKASQSLETVEHLETIIAYFKTFIKHFEASILQPSSILRPMGNKFLYLTTQIIDTDFSASEPLLWSLSWWTAAESTILVQNKVFELYKMIEKAIKPRAKLDSSCPL